MKRRGLWLILLGVTACGSDKPAGNTLPEGWGPGVSPAATGTAATGAPVKRGDPATSIDSAKETLLVEAGKRVYRNEDFIEGEKNRDPFRSYLADFNSVPSTESDKHKILLDHFSLDELRLVAIIGTTSAAAADRQAMFIDSTGFGVMVRRGDHVSRSDAKIVRITPEQVVLEFKEDLGNGAMRMRERIIELHPGESSNARGYGDMSKGSQP